jgi:hypothetical protein
MPEERKVHEFDSGDQLDKLARAMWYWLKSKFHRATLADIAVIFTNLLLVTVAVWAAIIYGRQLHTMNGQLNEMKGSSDQTNQMLCLYRGQLNQLTKQANDTHVLAVAAGKQADAAKSLADLNMRLVESQRASIDVGFGKVLNPIIFHDRAPSIAFSIMIKNTGFIEATNVNVRYTAYYIPWIGRGSNTLTDPLQRQRDYCAKNPTPIPDWTFDEHGKRINLKGLENYALTVEQRAEREATLSLGMAQPTDAEIFKWPPPYNRPPGAQVTDRFFPIVVGCVDYQSGAMPKKHQTGFIFEVHQVSVDGPGIPTFIHSGIDVPIDKVMIFQFRPGQGKKY